MIDEALAQRAVETLARLAHEYWDSVDSEIQDDSTFVLLRARAQTEADVQVPSEVRRAIAKELNALVPDHPNQELGSWMVVVLQDGQVRDSMVRDEV